VPTTFSLMGSADFQKVQLFKCFSDVSCLLTNEPLAKLCSMKGVFKGRRGDFWVGYVPASGGQAV
jgi:hypothetical protein